MGGVDGASWKLSNQGEWFFPHLKSSAVYDVNSQLEKSGLMYARKGMTWTGMSLIVNGFLEEIQLFSPLPGILATHRNHFYGEEFASQYVLRLDCTVL